MAVPTLIVTGPVGVGKTSVASEISEILEAHAIPHAAVDVDALAWYYPRPDDDPYKNRVALRNLSAVWQTFQEAGAERLVLARVIESWDELEWFREAIPGADIIVCRLRASIPVLRERIRQREIGSGLDRHVHRAAELAVQMDAAGVEDLVVDVEGLSVHEAGLQILTAIGWLG